MKIVSYHRWSEFFEVTSRKRFKNVEFVGAISYAPKPTDSDYIKKNDVPWLTRFAKAGGKIVVSGNVKMLVEPHELEALRRNFVVIMFERKWNNWNFHQKTALLLFHWPLVLTKLKTAKIGEVWCIPNHFRENAELRDVTPGNKEIKKTSPRRAARGISRKPRKRRSLLGGARSSNSWRARSQGKKAATASPRPRCARPGGRRLAAGTAAYI